MVFSGHDERRRDFHFDEPTSLLDGVCKGNPFAPSKRKVNVDLPMDGQPVWLVSGVYFAGSGRTISKEHFLGFESNLGKA